MEKYILIAFASLFSCLQGFAVGAFTLEQPGCEWEAVLLELQAPRLVKCEFTESRSNRFHRHPVRLEGTIRWTDELGLSILYEKPSKALVNINSSGVFLTKEGETRPLGGADQQVRFLELFLRLFSWDTDWLEQNFASEGSFGEGGEWELHLLPKADDLSDFLSRLVLTGDRKFLNGIQIDLRAGRAVQIDLFDQDYPESFCPSELTTAYPSIND